MTELELKEPKYEKRGYKKQSSKGYDDIYTPPSALLPLLPYLPRNWWIWECASGQNHLVDALCGHGFKVRGTDIKQGHDFLTAEPDRFADCILTNPPYSLKDQFLARCYELGKPFALLLPMTALEGQFRQSLYRQHGVEILFMESRVNYITPSGKGSGAWFPSIWLCWKLLPSPVIFSQNATSAEVIPATLEMDLL